MCVESQNQVRTHTHTIKLVYNKTKCNKSPNVGHNVKAQPRLLSSVIKISSCIAHSGFESCSLCVMTSMDEQ